jgi:hypothetical protein
LRTIVRGRTQGSPLHCGRNDDQGQSEKILKNNSNAVWFDILNDFNYVDYVEIAVSYYDALYDYNKYHNSVENHEGDQNKTIEDARERLLKRTNFR